MNKISAVINTFNASRYLDEVLKALAGFDEIVVCDMESTDNTVEIAESHGCKVVTFPKKDYSICEPARDFAIHSACNEWVLVVDADEIVTPELREYLYRRIGEDNVSDGMFVPRVNKFMGKYVEHASPDYQLRFFRKDRAKWPPVIHCIPVIDGRIEKIPVRLKGVHFLHLDDSPIASRISKMNVYTDYELPKRRNKRYGAAAMLWRPLWFFLRSYLFQGGIADGRRGIARSYMAAMYQMTQMAKILEDKLDKNGSNNRLVLEKGYDWLKDTVEGLHENFDMTGTSIFKGRNELRRVLIDGTDMVIKRYGRLNLFRRLVYRFRSSKARRAYYNGNALLRVGIYTPAPIGYMEVRDSLGFIRDSFYISGYTSMIAVRDGLKEEEGTGFNRLLTRQLAEFVGSLHDKGIIHLDLNSTNIVYTPSADGGAEEFGLIDLNRMKIKGSGNIPSLTECFDNLTRFSYYSPMFEYFAECYVKARRLPEEAIGEIHTVKKRHERFTERRRALKRLLK